MKSLGLLSLCLLYSSICVFNLRVSTCAALLEFGKICEKNEECDPHSTEESNRVLCDKISPDDVKGKCGCTGDAYNDPVLNKLGLINPKRWAVLGYAEYYNPAQSTEGCQRTQLALAPCDPAASNCNQAGFPLENPVVICRNVNVGDDPTFIGVENWRCAFRVRETKTFGHCGPDHELIVAGKRLKFPKVNCNPDAGLRCSLKPSFEENTILRACLPKEHVGAIDEKYYHCNHDTDCRDPNAKCMEAFPSDVKFSVIHLMRRLCLCDKQAGYDFDIRNGIVKCTQLPGFGEICQYKDDCGSYDSSDLKHAVTCKPYLATKYKTCQCEHATDQFYEGVQKADGKCRPFVDYEKDCNPNYAIGRDYRPLHNCRRVNNNYAFTGLVCQTELAAPLCGCRPHSTWDSTNGICVLKFVGLDERCDPNGGNGFLKCNPKGNLECKEKTKGTKEFACFCDVYSERVNDFSYCKRRTETVGYGGVCDDITLKCNHGKNLVCINGKCECYSDEHILDTGKECQEIQPGKKKRSKGTSTAASDWGPAYFHLIIPVACVLIC